MVLKVGDKAPQIDLKDQNGKPRRFKDLKGKILILFFYPKDDTPGCTAEACSFRDNYEAFKKLGVEIWGVSSDNNQSHINFTSKYKLPFTLISDENNNLRKKFGVSNTLGVIPGRVTYIISKEGIIIDIYKDLLNGPAHVINALKIIKEHTKQL